MLRVTILGCGGSGGVPLLGGEGEGGLGRLRPGRAAQPADPNLGISWRGRMGRRLLIDAGPDLREQLLAARDRPGWMRSSSPMPMPTTCLGIDELRTCQPGHRARRWTPMARRTTLQKLDRSL